MSNWEKLDAVQSTPGVVSGSWVFRGTRIPVAALFENLRDGATVDQFVEWFPGVTKEQVQAVMNFEAQQSNAVTEK